MKTQSDTIGKIAIALSKAQLEFEPILKDAKAHNYKYAPLENCYKATRRALVNNELAVTHTLDYENGEQFLVTKLIHSSEEFLASYTHIKSELIGNTRGSQPIQQWGAVMTYLSRYAYCLIIGAIGEEDTDGVILTHDNSQKVKTHSDLLKEQIKAQANIDLANLLKAKGYDPIAFTAYHGISSKKPETVKFAIENFNDLITKYDNRFLEEKENNNETQEVQQI